MGRGLHQGVEQVAAGAAGKHQAPTEAGPEIPTDTIDEDSAYDDIAGQVYATRMQGQGSDYAPPLAGENLIGSSIAELVPVDR